VELCRVVLECRSVLHEIGITSVFSGCPFPQNVNGIMQIWKPNDGFPVASPRWFVVGTQTDHGPCSPTGDQLQEVRYDLSESAYKNDARSETSCRRVHMEPSEG
jgi:hypothetical protein